MTLNMTQLLKTSDINLLLNKYIKSVPTYIKKNIVTESIGLYAFEGTCFDYCLRFLLARKFPDQTNKYLLYNWIATYNIHCLPLKEKDKWNSYIKKAKDVIAQFVSGGDISLERIAIISQYLANLDTLYRVGYYNKDFKHIDKITEELIDLMKDIPLNDFSIYNPSLNFKIYLNPDLTYNNLKADADLVIGNTLIDIKTVKDNSLTINYIKQLAGYYAILNQNGIKGINNPLHIEYIGIYFSRHKQLVTYNVNDLFNDPEKMSKDFISYINKKKDIVFYYNY